VILGLSLFALHSTIRNRSAQAVFRDHKELVLIWMASEAEEWGNTVGTIPF
jgi:hypothetical protein